MSLHLIKLCVGIEEVEQLRAWQAKRLAGLAKQGKPLVLRHFTRSTPKRAAELLDGGSLYWVIKGFVRARQRLIDIEPGAAADGTPRCAFVLDPELVRTQARPQRPFQGWRYLEPAKAPPDARGPDPGEGLPPELAATLRDLGLL
jgi:hypothetical protein